jgi:glycyl-tRNA synthetase beta chain
MLDRNFALSLSDAFRAAYDGYTGTKLDLSQDDLVAKLGEFFADRLRGLLEAQLPSDAVAACLAVAAERPLDARARATAIAGLDAATRASVGEVFKRATNIADKAPAGEPAPPAGDAHPSEKALYEGFLGLREALHRTTEQGDYAAAFRQVAALAPLLSRYFVDVFVMGDDNRQRLMRAISETCRKLARLELLGA